MPDDLARRLEAMAKAEDKSIAQVVLDYLRHAEEPAGSPGAILRTLAALPEVDPSAVDEMNAAIAAGRLAIKDEDLFRR